MIIKSSEMQKLVDLYRLTKPGVLFGNVLTGAAGYFFAAAGHIEWWTFLSLIVGMTLVVAASCALNNILDRDIDIRMERTRSRPSVKKSLSQFEMYVFVAALYSLGFALLMTGTNRTVVTIGVIGSIIYVWLYGMFTKRRSPYGVVPGSVSGAMPIIGGYAAVHPSIDWIMVALFFIMYFWQFPEFLSIAIYRLKEYKAANLPVFSAVYGVKNTIYVIVVTTVFYVIATLSVTLLGATGWVYFGVMLAAGLWWIIVAVRGLKTKQPNVWARTMFGRSMVHILIVVIMLSVGPLLP